MKKRKSKKIARKLTEQQAQDIEKKLFKKRVVSFFSTIGFGYIDTEKKETIIGNRKIEVDAVFFFENILLICEDTVTATSNIRDHIRTKNEAYNEIDKDKDVYIEWLEANFSPNADHLKKYTTDEYKVYYLYFSKNPTGLSKRERNLYQLIHFVEPQTLDYFVLLASNIKKTSRNELFRFLGIHSHQIGIQGSTTKRSDISASIIYPKAMFGGKEGIRVVSFMMSAKSLLDTCYVLRKDNWETSMWLYQRLLDGKKINKIRAYLAENRTSFYNNIIVSLPRTVRFINNQGEPLQISELDTLQACTLSIPDEINSICIIDGQHRVYAYYEGNENDKNEAQIAQLRSKLHLLVTGLIFPENIPENRRIQLESEIFYEINHNTKRIPPNILLQIVKLKDPVSEQGIANRVIEIMNEHGAFKDMFELSHFDKGKIKITSIIKFALNYLVTTEPSQNKCSLIEYWDGDKNELIKGESIKLIDEYAQFCASNISTFFGAVKKRFVKYWSDPSSRILSITSINGFIIAYTRLLSIYGLCDFEFYDNLLSNLDIDFSKDVFPYKSSSYNKFADEIIQKLGQSAL